MNKVKVSVIMPVYNAEKYLVQCLESVLRQTLNDIEIICVDDGSTDSSLKILREYESKDSRIKVLCQQNEFAGVARNKGMSIAEGKYYVFLDSDDYFEPEMLETMYKKCESTQAEICICDGNMYHDTKKKYIPVTHYLNIALIKSNFGSRDVFSADELNESIFQLTNPAPWNKMFSSEFVKNNNLYFSDSQRANDQYFVLTNLALANKITYINKELMHYRTGIPTSLQSNNNISPFDFILQLEKIKDTLTEKGIYEKFEKSLVNSVVTQTDYNLDKLREKNPKSYTELTKGLRSKYFPDFRIAEKGEDYFYEKNKYKKIINQFETIDILDKKINAPEYVKKGKASEENDIKVSVIVPVYNVEKYLNECIDSIINQTLKDIEIICVNDGSPDSCLEIIEKYYSEDDRVTVVSKPNGGLSSARNRGFSQAVGKYVYFIDSDDYLLPNALEVLYNRAEKDNLDILFFGAESFFESEELKKANLSYVSYYKREQLFDHPVKGDVMLNEFITKNLFRSVVQLQLINRKFMEETGLTFKDKLIHEDELFTPLLMVKANRTFCIEDVLYMRRIRGDSIMTSGGSHKNVIARFIVSEILRSYLESDDISELGKKGLSSRSKSLLYSSKSSYADLSKEEAKKTELFMPEEYIDAFNKNSFKKESKFTRAITYIPRKIPAAIRYYKDNGFKYTVIKIVQKVSKLLKTKK